jgi:hypothetical protein
MASNYGYGKIVTNGLVFALDAGDSNSYPGSGTAWTSIGSGQESITLTNGPTFSNRSFSFDGTNDHASINMAGTLISDPELNNMVISFNLWVRASSGYYILSTGAQTASRGVTFSYHNGTGLWGVRGQSTGRYWTFDNSADFPANTWINFCVACGGSTMILYKNGTQLYSKSIDASLNSYYGSSTSDSFTQMTIGRPNNLFNFYGQCDLPIIHFYDKKLSSTEVLQNYNAQKSRFGL